MSSWHRDARILAAAITLASIALFATGCEDSCLEGACPTPCSRMVFSCPANLPLYVGLVGDSPPAYRLSRSTAGADEVLISNGIVTAAIGKLDARIDLAPTGGNIVDLGRAGGADDMTIVYQLSGILPDDAFAYRSLEITRADDRVAVTVRGTLDGRPEVEVVTHYELRACDAGIRVRSELFNSSPDTQIFVLADATHWGKRRVVPFVPVEEQGYAHPELDLLSLTEIWRPYDYVTGAAPSSDSPAYATIACDRETISGVNDLEIAALGTPMTYVEPGDTLAYERLLVVEIAGHGPAPASATALAARAQLFPTPTKEVTGRIVAGGLPFGGDVRRASVVIYSDGIPVSAIVPAADGTFATTVPDFGLIGVDVYSFGVLANTFAPSPTPMFGDISVPEPATVQLLVDKAGTPSWSVVAFHPADDGTRAKVTGTFHGQFGECAPWLGPPHGASPACNHVLVAPTGTELEVPPGRYHVFATAGPEYTLGMAEVEVGEGDIESITFALEPLDLVPPGWLAADLHVHGRASFDSMVPDDDRVQSFVAAGVQVIAATDHDVIGDYTNTVGALGLQRDLAVMGGLEATQLIPWMDVPGADLPRVIGHFNFWPLRRIPSEPRAGAPSDEYLEPGELFDLMEPLVGVHGMMMLNHPWDEALSGRDQGYLRAVDFDPRRTLGDPNTNNSILLERPAGKHRNADWNLIEIINGSDQVRMQQARVLWHSLLAQGEITAGAGNSDSHGLSDSQLGWARNWVQAPTQVSSFDRDVFNAAVRDGKMIAGNGIVILVEVGTRIVRRGLGFTPYRVQPNDLLFITVKAPPWVPVEEVRVVTSKGTQVIAAGAQITRPVDPLSAQGVVRYQASIPLSQLVTGDDFLIVEAGLPYPDAEDFDDDGVPDTGDNNGDGIVDRSDIEAGEDFGPFVPPPDPREPTDPRYWVTRVVPWAWPTGFTNPLILDVDGGGWTPPGLP